MAGEETKQGWCGEEGHEPVHVTINGKNGEKRSSAFHYYFVGQPFFNCFTDKFTLQIKDCYYSYFTDAKIETTRN